MSKYVFEDLSDNQFENLIIQICRKLFGVGIQGFATGSDGGRDAKFVGTAEMYPSTNGPWTGTTIVQAKHTNGINKSFGDLDFFSDGSTSSVIAKEIPRIKKMRDEKKLDNYIIFSNRRSPALSNEKILDEIHSKCSIPQGSVTLLGVENIEEHLKDFSDIAEKIGLDMYDNPLVIDPNDLSDVIRHIVNKKDLLKEALKPANAPTDRIAFDEKNEFNQMSKNFADGLMRKYLKHSGQVKKFLADPTNEEIQSLYQSVADELDNKIQAYKTDFPNFDRLYEHVVDILFGRDQLLSRHKRLTRCVLFHMYWSCDIGSTADA